MTPQVRMIAVLAAIILAAAAIILWVTLRPSGPGVGFVSGNGRVEATEIDVATKVAGRVVTITVNDGDFVQAGPSPRQKRTVFS